MKGPYVIVCRAHSGGRVLAEAFVRNRIQMGHVREATKDTYYFAVRRNPIFRELTNKSYDYEHYSPTEKKSIHEKIKYCVGQFLENEIERKEEAFGWKFGESLFLTPMILDAYPTAKVIHIIRDGRDVMLSRIPARFESNIQEPFNRLIIFGSKEVKEFEGKPFNSATIKEYRNELEILHWNTCVQFGMKCRKYEGRYTELKYEDLCNDPESSLTQIFEFLNMKLNPPCLDWALSNISKDRIGKWKNLSQVELDLALKISSQSLKELGYL